MTMTIETVHPDILKNEKEIGRWEGPIGHVVEIRDPGEGVWGTPEPGLIDVHYKCTQVTEWHNCFGSIHIATYGPTDEVSPESGYSLYAD